MTNDSIPVRDDLTEREFPYKPKWLVLLFGLVLLGGMTWFFAWLAWNNDRGLILEHFIELPTGAATIFYWVLDGFSAALCLMMVWMIAWRLQHGPSMVLTLTPSALVLPPQPWTRQPRRVEYASVQRLSRQLVNRQEFLQVHHSGGKVSVGASLLPSRPVFEEVCLELATRVAAARGAGGSSGSGLV